MPAIDISQLAALDERDPGSARRAPAPAAADPRFAPPAELDGAGDDQPLDVERSTRAIRLENEFRAAQAPRAAPRSAPSPAAPRAAPPPAAAAPSRSIRGVALAIALIAAVAIGVAALVLRAPGAPSRPPRSGAGVSIRIIAREPTAVTIDGHPAGNTPLTLQRPPGTAPILITAPGAARQVIPDRDQTVDLSPR